MPMRSSTIMMAMTRRGRVCKRALASLKGAPRGRSRMPDLGMRRDADEEPALGDGSDGWSSCAREDGSGVRAGS
jgi:hypothetical protein